MPGGRNPVLTFLFAALILLFTGGPVALSLYGSLVPDRILLDPEPERIFGRAESGELPLCVFRRAAGVLPAGERQPRDDIGRRASGAAQPAQLLDHRGQRNAAQHASRGAGRLHLRALRVPRKEAQLHVPDPVPAGSGRSADHADLHDARGLRSDRNAGRDHPRPHGQGAALHRADPVGVLPQDPAGALRSRSSSTTAAACRPSCESRCRSLCRRSAQPACSPSCSPTPNSCSRWFCRAMPQPGQFRS